MSAQDESISRRFLYGEWLTGPRLLVVVLLVLLASVLVPRAIVRGATTVSWDFGSTPGVPGSLIHAPANEHAPATAPPFHGDVGAGIHPLYNVGQSSGERIGLVYYWFVGTAVPQGYESAGNHVFGVIRLEIVGKGSLDLMGTASFIEKSYLSVSGGTGAYAGAGGECVMFGVSPGVSRFTCTLQ